MPPPEIPKRARGRPPLPADRRREKVYLTLSPQAHKDLNNSSLVMGMPHGHSADVAFAMLSAFLSSQDGLDFIERERGLDSIRIAQCVAEKIAKRETVVVDLDDQVLPALEALRQAIDE